MTVPAARLRPHVPQLAPERLSPVAIDRLIATLLIVGTAIELAAIDRRSPYVLELLGATAMALTVLLRRRAPELAAVLYLGAASLQAALLTSVDRLGLPFVGLLVLAYSAGRHAPARRAALSLAILTVAVAVVNAQLEGAILGDYVFPPLIAAGTAVTGGILRRRTELVAGVHEAAARAREARARDEQEAVAAERRRIARELHDVVAHSMSVMVVQAGGARRILGQDPARAGEAAERIEATGRTALAEMRRLLGVLHPEQTAMPLQPAPTLADLPRVVADARAAGLTVELDEHGDRRPLPAGLELAAFRVVQEALTNAIKHAPGSRVAVELRWSADGLRVDVADDGAGEQHDVPGGGHGLVGMAERVRLYGGTLHTGPRPGGGFAVSATLPAA